MDAYNNLHHDYMDALSVTQLDENLLTAHKTN
jgi:hypothetical protein